VGVPEKAVSEWMNKDHKNIGRVSSRTLSQNNYGTIRIKQEKGRMGDYL
jgi:hypothetical protein